MNFIQKIRCILTMGRGVVSGLPEASAGRDPIELFGEWFEAAGKSGILLPETIVVATASAEGRPSARCMLLKGFDQRGFHFYTNYESRKADELEANPYVALVLHWAVLQRQVRIEGKTSRVSEEESAAYFQSRPRGSRIGAWASMQSRALDKRATLESRVREFEKKFPGDEVPLPPFWGGYLVEPERIEFWQGRSDRLHDRLCFVLSEEGWSAQKLYP
jgi:pyridoxamine 5'-phosphate oxidase